MLAMLAMLGMVTAMANAGGQAWGGRAHSRCLLDYIFAAALMHHYRPERACGPC